MKNLIIRTISGIIYVALIVGATLGGAEYFYALTAILCILGINEFLNITEPQPISKLHIATRAVDTLAGVAITLCFIGNIITAIPLSLSILAFFILRIVLALYDKQDEALHAIYRSFFSQLYISLPLLALNILYLLDGRHGCSQIVLAMFIMIWLNDTGAFCVGSTMGRRRLCERLSPKKSWEGFYGGLVFCILAGVGCFYLSDVPLHIAEWIIMGVIVCLFSTWGDLFESLIKRTLHVKDSGNIIPGHGGILDRIDSLLLVAPAVLLYFILIRFIF
jgi:phosphatidate cytidylyltransferase